MSATKPKPLSHTQQLLREPLLHFVVLGALLFGIDHVVAGRQDDPHRIVVGPEVDAEASALYRESRGRDPSPADLKQLRERWIDNEVLYREGLALRVDQGDPTIRERVIFKALNVVQANLEAPPLDENGLRAWFDQHRADYAEPMRLDFVEAVIPGDASAAQVAEFVAALNQHAEGQAQGALRVFKGRPRTTVVESFGAEFTAALEKAPVGQWQTLSAKDGVHIVRLDSVAAAIPADFAAIRGEVLQDWKDATLQELRTRAVRELGKKYTVVVEAPK